MTAKPTTSRTLPPATPRAALCWRVERADGEVFGFTDHDAPITFGGLTYEARPALRRLGNVGKPRPRGRRSGRYRRA